MTGKIQELIDHLQGSSISLDEGCENMGLTWEDLTTEDFNEIDQQIFKCEVCGWWFEIAEQAEGQEELICQSCHENE